MSGPDGGSSAIGTSSPRCVTCRGGRRTFENENDNEKRDENENGNEDENENARGLIPASY